ncbi:MAG: hypothetical protein ACYSU1_04805 [Planctomycetota bacterium]
MKNTILFLLLAALGSCANSPRQLSIHDLEDAHRLYAAGEYEAAEDVLDNFNAEDFDLPTQRDYNLLYGLVGDGLGDWNTSIRHYEAYMTQSGPAQDARAAEQRLLELGTQLIEGDLRVFWIFTDKSRGIITLENLALLGNDPHMRAAAMARVAEYHFEWEDYDDAMIFYAGLLQPDFRGLGWDDSASFQLANCHYGLISLSSLNGPAVQFALEQFRAYLERYPGGLHRIEAQRKFDICRDLLSQYHRIVGDYYVRIDNAVGAKHHYSLAAGMVSQGDDSTVDLVRDTPAAAKARAILADFEAQS